MPKRREICLLGDAAHSRVPVAFWDPGAGCQISVNGGRSTCETNWPANVPDQAKNSVPFASIAGVDRFTVVQHDVGVSPAHASASQGSLRASPDPLFETDYGQPAWGAAISVEALRPQTPPPSGDGVVRLNLSTITSSGATSPLIESLTITVENGATEEIAAERIYDAVQGRLNADSASLPVRVYLVGRHVLFDGNPRYDFNRDGRSVFDGVFIKAPEAAGDADYFPRLEMISNTHPKLSAVISGGARTPGERAVQHQQVALASEYGPVLLGKGSVVFASGFMPVDVGFDDNLRSVTFGEAAARCFDDCESGDVIEDWGGVTLPGDQIATPVPTPNPSGAAVCLPVSLVAMEVNQVIQTWNNDIPLIKYKSGVVRAFFESNQVGRQGFKVKLRGYSFRNAFGDSCDPAAGGGCERYELGSPPAPSPAIQAPRNAAQTRDDLSVSASFKLPPAWTTVDHLELKVEAATNVKLACRERADHTQANDCRIRVHLEKYQRPVLGGTTVPAGDGKPISLRQIPMDWSPGDTDLSVTDEDRVMSAVALQNLLPIGPIGVDLLLPPQWQMKMTGALSTWSATHGPVPNGAWYRNACPNCNAASSQAALQAEAQWFSGDLVAQRAVSDFRDLLLVQLDSERRATRSIRPAHGGNEVYQGLFHTPLMIPIGGLSGLGGGAFVEDVGGLFASVYITGAHEFMHAVGRQHTD